MKGIKKQKDLLTASSIAGYFSKVYFLLILIFLPFYMDSTSYFGLSEAKAHAYWLIVILMLLGIVITIWRMVKQKEKWIASLDSMNAIDYSVLAYAVSVIISFLLCENKMDAYTGGLGFDVGVFTIITMIIFYFFVSRGLQGEKKLWNVVLVMNGIILVWSICNAVSIDVLWTHGKTTKSMNDYYATIGQMNCVSAYLCLLLPIVIVFYLDEQEKKDQRVYRVFLQLGFTALVGIGTDGVYIGVTVCLLFLLPFVFEQKERIERMLHLTVLLGVGMIFYRIVCIFHEGTRERFLEKLSGISAILVKYWLGAIVIIAALLLLYLYKKKQDLISEHFLQIGRTGSALLVGLVLLVFIVHSIITFDFSWGTYRGAIWTGSVQMYADFTLKKKIFGCGTELVAIPLTKYVMSMWGTSEVTIATCHNDFLQNLLTIGVVGVTAYMSIWIMVIREFFKRKKNTWSTLKSAYFMAIMAYMGQAFVGSPYSLTVPMLFLVMALFRNAS